MDKKKIIIIGAASAALLVIIALVMAGRSGRDSGREGAGGDQKDRGLFDIIGFGGGSEEKDQALSPKAFHLESAADYRERAKWPEDSIRITHKNDPVTEDNTIRPAEVPDPKHPEGPFLVHYLKKTSFEPSEPLVIHAYIVDSSKRKIPPQTLKAFLTIGGMQGRSLATMDLQDGGGNGDEKAGDLVYTASFILPPELQGAGTPPQNLIVVLKAQADGAEFTATNGFNVGWLNIRHTGKFRDRVASDEKGSHLFIDAEFEVKKTGTYHVQASLYDDDDEAIGWSQNRLKLDPGIHVVPLRFYGKMFCDTRKNGPYVLRNLVYANTSVMPGPRSQNQQNLFKTGEHKHNQFTCNSYDDAQLLQKAKQMEAEASQERN